MEIRYTICDKCEADGRDKNNKLHTIKMESGHKGIIIHLCERCIERVSLEIPEINVLIGKKMPDIKRGRG